LAKVVKRLSDAILEDKSGVNPDGPIEVAEMREILPLMPNVNLFRDLVRLDKQAARAWAKFIGFLTSVMLTGGWVW
jgi:hypothetical protein